MNTPNSVTQQVIAFLSQPDLPFGAVEDLLLLSAPEALQAHVATLLQENPSVLDGDAQAAKEEDGNL